MRSNPVAGQNLFGTAVRQRAPNEIAAWRYVAFALVVVIACLYALPNLYPPDYALQISADNAAEQVDEAFLGDAETRLEVAGIAVKGIGGWSSAPDDRERCCGSKATRRSFAPVRC